MSEYVSIRQHTSAYVSIPQHTSAYVIMRQHASAYGEKKTHTNTDSGMHDGLQWGKSAVELAAEGNSGRGHSEEALCQAAKNDLRAYSR
jgi:hypothetical protein